MRRDRSAVLGEIMSRHVICVRPEQAVEELVELMLDHNIGGLPVVDHNDKLVGIVTESDILRGGWEPTSWELFDGDDRGYHTEPLPRALVGELMTPFVFSLPIDTPVVRAAALMAYEGVHRIGVVASDSAFVGLVTSLDVMRWIAREDGYLVGDTTVRQTAHKGPIMIIDDDPDLTCGYGEVISDEGYAVVTATNGADAMARLEPASPPSLIILDLNMPVMDGRRFRSELLRDPRTARIPIVVISGDHHVPAEIKKLGVNGYLTKPVTLERLLATVEQYCN